MNNSKFRTARIICIVFFWLFITLFLHESEDGSEPWIPVLKWIAQGLLLAEIVFEVVVWAYYEKKRRQEIFKQIYNGEIAMVGVSFVGKRVDAPRKGEFTVSLFATHDAELVRGFYAGEEDAIEKVNPKIAGHCQVSYGDLSQIARKKIFLPRTFYEQIRFEQSYTAFLGANTVEIYEE